MLIVIPCKLPFLLCLDPHLLKLIYLLLLSWHVLSTLLLKLSLLDTDLPPGSYLCAIQHIYSHLNRLYHSVAYTGVSLRHPALFVSVELDLLLPGVGVQADHTTTNEVVFQFLLVYVIWETLNVDVVIDLGLVPLSLLVLHVPLLLQLLQLLLFL